MSLPLFKSLDYSDTEIATVTKLFGFWVALGATFFSAYIIRRIGMMPSLLLARSRDRLPISASPGSPKAAAGIFGSSPLRSA